MAPATKQRQPAAPEWVRTAGSQYRLLGTRCAHCTTVFFPPKHSFCANPYCQGTEFEEIELSERGTIWSYTSVQYRPPEPFVADPNVEWQPYVLLAVELSAERILVLGQAPPRVTVDDVEIGMRVRLAEGVLYEDAHTVYTTWNFLPEPQGVGA